MPLWNHFRHPDHHKMRIGWGRKAMFQVVARHYELIFSLLTTTKCSLCELKKAMFQVFGRHCELIFCLLASPKCDLCEVEKAMNQVIEWYFEVILCVLTSRKRYFFQVDNSSIQVVEWHLKVIFYLFTSPKFGSLISFSAFWTSPKCDFGEVEKEIFQVVARPWDHIFYLLTSSKCDLVEFEKVMFLELACHFERIFGVWPFINASWVILRKRSLKSFPGTPKSFSVSWPPK